MRTLPRAAQLFVVAVVLTGGILLDQSLRVATFDRVPLLMVLVVTAMLCARVKLRLPTTKNRSTMSVSNGVVFTSLLLLGPHPTMVVAVAGGWCQSTFGTRRPNPLYRTFFNIAALLLAGQPVNEAERLDGKKQRRDVEERPVQRIWAARPERGLTPRASHRDNHRRMRAEQQKRGKHHRTGH